VCLQFYQARYNKQTISALKYLFKFLCSFEQISIRTITLINKLKSNNIVRTRLDSDSAKVNRDILFTRSLFYEKTDKSMPQKLLSNVEYYKSELNFDKKTKSERSSSDSKKLFKISIEIENNFLSSDTNSRLLQKLNRRFIIKSSI